MSRKFLLSPLLLLLALGGMTACGDDSESETTLPSDDKTPDSAAVLSGFTIQTTEAGENFSTASRVWYGVRADDNSDSDLLSTKLIEEMRGHENGYTEGVDFRVDAKGRPWIGCGDHNVWREQGWCEVSIPAPCFDGADCTYDFRISREALSEGVADGQDWDEAPEAWIQGSFRWSDEFIPPRFFWAYQLDKEAPVTHASVELTVDSDTIQSRGFIRRLQEDQGITVEVLPYED